MIGFKKSRKIIGFFIDAGIDLEYCVSVRVGHALGARRVTPGSSILEFAPSDRRKKIGKFSHCATVA
jgi:hypothetical protein